VNKRELKNQKAEKNEKNEDDKNDSVQSISNIYDLPIFMLLMKKEKEWRKKKYHNYFLACNLVIKNILNKKINDTTFEDTLEFSGLISFKNLNLGLGM
jgi:hypothetical protein